MRYLFKHIKALIAAMYWTVATTLAWASPSTATPTFAGWMDTQGNATIETVAQQAAWEPFTGWEGWAYGSEPVWIKVHVPATKEPNAPSFILVVRPPFLDKVRFFDPFLGVEKMAGDHFPAKDDALGSVLFTFDVPALPADRNVYIQFRSTSARILHLSLMPLPEAQAHTRFVEWFTGFVLVLSIVFFTWAVVHWQMTRDRIMGIFAIKQGIITLWGFLFFGFGRLSLGPFFDEGTLSLISSIAVSGLLWSGLWFFSTLLQYYKARPWMLRSMQFTAMCIACLSLINFFGYTQLALKITNSLSPGFLFWIVLTLWCAPKTQEQPLISKNALLAYIVTYGVLHTLPTLMHVGLLDESPILSLGNMGLLVLDGFVMLILLSVRQRRFKEQHQAVTTQLLLQQEQARLDQQYQDEQRKLLAMLAHEMKTPLANLRIWMEAGPKGRPVMERAILDMDRVIERCVHAGLLQDHSLQPHNEWLDATELTQSVLDTSRQPTRVHFSLPTDICPALADAQMLSIVLSNVLENAYKYGDTDTSILLVLAPHASDDGRPGWRWTFENAVCEAGLPDPDKVFDKYYRSASAKRQSGSGLGLFLVKSLVDLMHGRVSYTPQYQRVRFEIWLPMDSRASDLTP